MQVGPSAKVIKYLNENPNSRAKAVIDSTDLDAQTVYRVLSYLHKTNKLRRRAGKYSVAYDLPMTAITAEEKQPAPTENPVTNVMRKTEAENKRLHAEVESLHEQLKRVSVKYYDAMAVVKYLEKKLDGNA